MESGPWALAECNSVLDLFYLEFLETWYRLENLGVFFIEWSPTRPTMHMHELHSEATWRLTLTESSSLPSLPMATPLPSIWHAIPSVTLTLLASIAQGRPLLPEWKYYLKWTPALPKFPTVFFWSIFSLITKTKQFPWRFR